MPGREWQLLETVCYEAGRRVEDIQYLDLRRPIAQWKNKSWMDLVGRVYTRDIARRNLVGYVVKRLKQSNFIIPSLNRYKIFKAQIEECKREKKVDLGLMLPETIRELYKLMCKAACSLPLDVDEKTFSVYIPELGKSLSDLGLLRWYVKKKNYSGIEEALKGIKRDREFNIKDLREEVIKENKRAALLRKIEQYGELKWEQELVVSEKRRAELREKAKKSRIYRQFKDVPNFRQIGWSEGECEVLVKAWKEKGDRSAHKRLIERYSRMVAERALLFVGRGVDYTLLVKFGIEALHDTINDFDFGSGEKFPVFFNREVFRLLPRAVSSAKIAATSIVEEPKSKYGEDILKFLYDFGNALKRYKLELDEKIRSDILVAKNSAIRDGINPLTEKINYSISVFEAKGLTPKSEKTLVGILDLLGKIKISYEYCIRAYYGLGDTRYNLQVGMRKRLREIAKAKILGKSKEKENARQKIRGGFRSMVRVYMQNLN